ncbi:MAG: insulinase family protein [Firmicutes bacterium]|nr:insulinase family protein [Bacillota bacterium]
MYKKTVLPNGIKVLTEEINEFKSASIGVWVHTGPKYETARNMGVSHFIEHMLFKGTTNHSAFEIAEIMDSVGGHMNAFTEKEQTCFYVRVMDKHIDMSLNMLADMFMNSLFDPKEIERERGVILEEIRMYEDAPDDVVFEEFNRTLWADHPLACPTLGTIDIISKMSRDDFMEYMKDTYTPDNVYVAAAGHLKHEDIVALAEQNFGKLQGKVNLPRTTLPEFYSRNKLRYKDCEQAYICMGSKGLPQMDENKYVFYVLDAILGGSMSSRLFQEIREKRGLVYTVSTFTNSYVDTAQFGIYACTSVENLNEVVKLSNGILDDICENGVTEKEVIRSKEHIKGGISLALESTSNRMIRLNKSEMYYGRLIPIEEVIKKVDAVTLEDVNNLAKDLLDRRKFSATVLGPIKETLSDIPGEWTVSIAEEEAVGKN